MVALCGLLVDSAVYGMESYALWSKRMPITFSGYTPPGGGMALTNFPALVVLGESTEGDGFSYSDFMSPPYGDLRFAAADKVTPLDFEVESWNMAGASYVWVKVPELTATTTIYAMWGKAGVTVPDCTTNGAVWSEGFAAVWHMSDGDIVPDSTTNILHGVGKNGVATTSDSLTGKALVFDPSKGNYIDCGTELKLHKNSATLGVWIKTSTKASTIMGLAGKSVADNVERYSLYLNNKQLSSIFQGNAAVQHSTSWLYGDEKWHQIVAVYKRDSDSILYVDGVEMSRSDISKQSQIDMKSAKHFFIGAYVASSGNSVYSSSYFNGFIDEVRLKYKESSTDWIWAEYMSMASNGVFSAYGDPEWQDLPYLKVNEVVEVTSVSGILTGTLVSTGFSATAVSVYWGAVDGGEDSEAWEGSEPIGSDMVPGGFSTVISGLTAGTNYYVRLMGVNESGVSWSEPLYFITGEVWLEKVADASEVGLVPGTVVVHRAASVVAEPLLVNYSINGMATPDEDYVALSGKVVIPAGETNAVIEIVPLFDHLIEGTETVVLTLASGAYVIGSESQAVVEIEDLGQLTRTWQGGVGELASESENWAEGEVPILDDKVVLGAGSGNMTWDIDVPVRSWRQESDYAGTVTFKTVYPGQGSFTNFVVTGDVELLGGTWTHPANSGGDVAVNRLCVTVGGDFTLGAAASINLDGCGYAAAMGPGAGNSAATTSGRSASHGGSGARLGDGKGTYGSATCPEYPGSGAYSPGGGALKLAVGGDASIDGTVSAQGVNLAANGNYCHGAGGSVMITAASFSGSGHIRAGIDRNGQTPYYGSGGGRVALRSATAGDFSALTISAYAHNAAGQGYGNAGTIYLETPSARRLVIDNGNVGDASANYTDIPAKLHHAADRPAFDGELADVTLIVTNGGRAGLTSDLRIGDIAWLDGTLALNSWTLYAKAAAPANAFPDDYGNGVIIPAGTCYTFADGVSLSRDGRLFWDDTPVTWRVVTTSHPPTGGTTTVNAVEAEIFIADGAAAKIVAAPAAGHSFKLWDGTHYSTANPCVIAAVTNNVTMRAWFSGDAITNIWLATPLNNDWFDPRNWSLYEVPQEDQDVLVKAGAGISLTNTTAVLGSFTMTGGILTFANWETALKADTIVISGGTVNHQVCDTTIGEDNIHRVYLICTDFTLGASAKLDGYERGYRGGAAGKSGRGQGPGGALDGGGGGNGGNGSVSQGGATGGGGQAYGSTTSPAAPGSGGGGTAAYNSTVGGAPGGGVVRIVATGKVTLNGTIDVSCARSSTTLSGRGAGGSVYISCTSFAANNGTINANGGGRSVDYWAQGGCGGGGRVAIVYDTAAQALQNAAAKPLVNILADGGNHTGLGSIGHWDLRGRPGTIHLSDASFFPDQTKPLKGGLLVIPGFTAWSHTSLAIDGGLAGFPDGFVIDIPGDLTISGSGGGLMASNPLINVAGDYRDTAVEGHSLIADPAGGIMNVAGSLLVSGYGERRLAASTVQGQVFSFKTGIIVTNGATMGLRSTVVEGIRPGPAATLASGGGLTVAANARLLPRALCTTITNAIPFLIKARDIHVLAGGTVASDATGFPGGDLPKGITSGYGPGGGKQYGGGGYGGRGGYGGGDAYGAEQYKTPLLPGSGGGTWNNGNGDYGGTGGGVVWLEAERRLLVDGTVSANGASMANYSGGGAGGSVYLRGAYFDGGGIIRANGGNGRTAGNGSGSGGGGRVAIWRRTHGFTGTAEQPVAGDTYSVGYRGEPGTIYWGDIPAQGTILLLR